MIHTPDSRIENILRLHDTFSPATFWRLKSLVQERDKTQDFLVDDVARGLLGLFATVPAVGRPDPDEHYINVIRLWTGETSHPDLLFDKDKGHTPEPSVYIDEDMNHTLIFERSEQVYDEIRDLVGWCEKHGLFFWIDGESRSCPGYGIRFGVAKPVTE